MNRATRRRVARFGKPYRDPFMDDLQVVLNRMAYEAREKRPVAVDAAQAVKALICDTYSEPCFICSNKPDTVQIYHVPEHLAKFNQKLIFYSLCGDCKMDVTTRATVEERLAMQLVGENTVLGVA